MLANEIFARLHAIWGTRWLLLWRGADMAEVHGVWDEALRGIAPERIRAALTDCQNAEKPPMLPEFLALCRAHAAPAERQPRLEYHGEPTSREQAKANVERIRGLLASVARGRAARDPMFWAKHPKGALAVWLLARGAKGDYRLSEVLLSHLDDAGERCRSDEAAAALLEVYELPEWRGLLEKRARGVLDDDEPMAA